MGWISDPRAPGVEEMVRLAEVLSDEAVRDEADRIFIELSDDSDAGVRAGAIAFLAGLAAHFGPPERVEGIDRIARRLMSNDPSPQVRAYSGLLFALVHPDWTADDDRTFVEAFRSGLALPERSEAPGLARALRAVPAERRAGALAALADVVADDADLGYLVNEVGLFPAEPATVAFCRRIFARTTHAKTRLRAAGELRRAHLIPDEVLWMVVHRDGGTAPWIAAKALASTATPPPPDVLRTVVRAWIAEPTDGETCSLEGTFSSIPILTALTYNAQRYPSQLVAAILGGIDQELPADDARRVQLDRALAGAVNASRW